MCERLLNSLESRFGYLLDSAIHKAATALDPRIKLSFADCQTEGKVFVFDSTDVIQSIKNLLPTPQVTSTPQQLPVPASSLNETQPAKKLKLLDFCSTSEGSSTDYDAGELQSFFDQPRLAGDANPIKYWTQRIKTPLASLALQLLTIPCSSAPVERLFSKAGIVLSKRRTRTSTEKLEKLIFLK